MLANEVRVLRAACTSSRDKFAAIQAIVDDASARARGSDAAAAASTGAAAVLARNIKSVLASQDVNANSSSSSRNKDEAAATAAEFDGNPVLQELANQYRQSALSEHRRASMRHMDLAALVCICLSFLFCLLVCLAVYVCSFICCLFVCLFMLATEGFEESLEKEK